MPFTFKRPEISAHYRAVARLHARGITEGFLSTLGLEFLSRLYAGIDHAPDCGVILAARDGDILGFVSYSKDTRECYRCVIRANWPRLVWALIPRLFRLSIYRKLGETLSYPRRKRHPLTEDDTDRCAGIRPELLSMAVDESTRGTGVGKALVLQLDDVMSGFGVPGYYVVTHGSDTRSNGFYQSCGFMRTREFFSHGKPMVEYYKTLAAAEGDDSAR